MKYCLDQAAVATEKKVWVKFDSIHFDSIQFKSTRFNSIQFNSILVSIQGISSKRRKPKYSLSLFFRVFVTHGRGTQYLVPIVRVIYSQCGVLFMVLIFVKGKEGVARREEAFDMDYPTDGRFNQPRKCWHHRSVQLCSSRTCQSHLSTL